MTQRITIALPDSLYERLQTVKDNLNVSQICQQAIDTAVRIEELRKVENPGMKELVQRLKIEKEEAGQEWKAEGFERGQQDALELSLSDFREIENNIISDASMEWIARRHFENAAQDMESDAFLAGWKEGVLSVWETVKNSL